MTTVAAIAKKALDGVSAKITDAVHDAVLSHDTQGAYDAVSGEYAITTTTANGRAAMATEKAAADIFPDYTIGPSDKLVLLEGFTSCAEGYRVAFAGDTYHITRVQDIAAAGSLFYAMARKVP